MSLLMEDELETPAAPLPKTPVLITAATKWEAEPLAKALNLAADGPSRWTGTVSGRAVTLLKTGVGAKNTADALGALKPADFGLVLSAGLCGAMNPSVRAGDLIADAREAELDLVRPLRETALAMAAPFHFGKILHTNIVLQPKSKKALGEEQRAVACDMESQAVRRWAGPTAAIGVRVVLDEMAEACPAETPDGEGFGAQAAFALSNLSSLPLLIKTGWRASRGMKTLSSFLKAYLENI
jgi:adenosylhomocysteine nucleosidase